VYRSLATNAVNIERLTTVEHCESDVLSGFFIETSKRRKSTVT
jgi:hypothetical protein